MTIAGIVLAAGRGTRFAGGAKMLADLGGKPLVRRAAETAIAGGLAPVTVILGHERAEVARALDGLGVTLVENPRYADGLSTSLKAGFAALPTDASAAMILLGDMPGVGPDLVRCLLQAWSDTVGAMALVPTVEGRRGNPVILSRSLGAEIAALEGDTGAGPLLRGRPDVVEYPILDPGITLDVDTAEALDRVRAAQASTTPSSTAT